MTNIAAASFTTAAATNVANAAAFTEMRQHILNLYQGVNVTHSFVQGAQTYDCIPVEQQPSVRMSGVKGIAAPPSAPAKPGGAPTGGTAAVLAQSGEPQGASFLPTTGTDQFGNGMTCEDHTVPIQRTTLEQISRFPSLLAFLSKGANAQEMPPVSPKGGPAPAGKLTTTSTVVPRHLHETLGLYAYNLGGSSTLNLWNPRVYPQWGQDFSLSQVWYYGFSGQTYQTIEAGWQVFPNRLGDNLAHLFIYFTEDGYKTTGCYDHSCPAFIQYSGRVFPGQTFAAYSTAGGAQYETRILWEWWMGNWWLSVDGEWVGYYPGWLFGTGELATHSTSFAYGGEITAGDGRDYYYFPEEGSGFYASNGFQLAAYQRQIWYFDANWLQQTPNLSPDNHECTIGASISGPYQWGPWGTYFFFGGPAGNCF
jgi:hypothetical protein